MNVKVIAGVSLALGLAGCAAPQASRTTVQVPEALNPGAHEVLAFVVPAKGQQIYECRPSKERAGAYEWAFVAPEADLFDTAGKRIGRHYAGPHWEAEDGSKIVGAVKQRSNAPDAGSIPWLLLGAKSVGNVGAFSKVTSIQRVATVGGVAPERACDEAGARARVHYTADYYFFTSR
jgi:hypothetical protein